MVRKPAPTAAFGAVSRDHGWLIFNAPFSTAWAWAEPAHAAAASDNKKMIFIGRFQKFEMRESANTGSAGIALKAWILAAA
jgi:hypothetical protein